MALPDALDLRRSQQAKVAAYRLMFDAAPLAAEEFEVTRVAAMHGNSRVQRYWRLPGPVLKRIVVENRTEAVTAAVRAGEPAVVSPRQSFGCLLLHDRYSPAESLLVEAPPPYSCCHKFELDVELGNIRSNVDPHDVPLTPRRLPQFDDLHVLSSLQPVSNKGPRGLVGEPIVDSPLRVPYTRRLPLRRSPSAEARIVPTQPDETDHPVSNVIVDAAKLRRSAADWPPRSIHISYDLM